MAKQKPKSPQAEKRQNPSFEEFNAQAVEKIEALYRLDDVDRAIIQLKVRYPGMSIADMAEHLGYGRQWLGVRMNRPGFKAAMAELTKSVMDALVDAQLLAIQTLKKECRNEDPELRIAAAKALLAPLARMENSPTVQQNLVYSIQFGEGGQLYKSVRPMQPQEIEG